METLNLSKQLNQSFLPSSK